MSFCISDLFKPIQYKCSHRNSDHVLRNRDFRQPTGCSLTWFQCFRGRAESPKKWLIFPQKNFPSAFFGARPPISYIIYIKWLQKINILTFTKKFCQCLQTPIYFHYWFQNGAKIIDAFAEIFFGVYKLDKILNGKKLLNIKKLTK